METPPDAFVVDLDRFQGPLDLLLHLIRKQDIDIFDIPISRITEQFLRAIQAVERLELERAGDFLEMAATLVRIKVQMLFPRASTEEEDDPRADLVRRLLEYEHFRDSAQILERAERTRARLFARGYVEPRTRARPDEQPLETAWPEVWAAVLRLEERLRTPEPGYRIGARMVRMDEKIELIETTLAGTPRIEFDALVAPWGTRIHAVVSLLACLELTKRTSLTIRQAAPFAPLWLYRREAREAA